MEGSRVPSVFLEENVREGFLPIQSHIQIPELHCKWVQICFCEFRDIVRRCVKVFSFTGLLFFPFIPLELDQRDTEPQVASWANFENPTSSHEWMFLEGWFSKWMDEEGIQMRGISKTGMPAK
jgi:hypothetical protein